MSLIISDFVVLIAFTTVLTTASTTVIIYKSNHSLESQICNKIEKLHERINYIAIRIGIVENQHDKCPVN